MSSIASVPETATPFGPPEPPRSVQLTGVRGLNLDYLRGNGDGSSVEERSVRRAWQWLDGLSDRHLARTYARYLRVASTAAMAYATTRRWPEIGLYAQALRRLHAAYRLMKERRLYVPEDAEAWMDVRRSEVYGENLDTYDALSQLSLDELTLLLAELEAELEEHPTCIVRLQRHLLLYGRVVELEREIAADGAGVVMETSPEQARIFRTRAVNHMSRKLGYQFTPTEADQLLRAIGFQPRPRRSDEHE